MAIAGRRSVAFIEKYEWFGDAQPKSWQWTSSSPTIASVSDTTGCWNVGSVQAVSRGKATITNVITFEVSTVVGPKLMQETVSVQATIY